VDLKETVLNIQLGQLRPLRLVRAIKRP